MTHDNSPNQTIPDSKNYLVLSPERAETYAPMRKMGRCLSGAESDGGRLYHGVNRQTGKAICGNNPQRRSVGWSATVGDAVTCPMCVRKLTKSIPPRTPTQQSWDRMKQRCNDPKHVAYHNYGGRGIKVCERWQNSFETFLADMGERPSKRHSLDRYPDKDGNYEPSNCRWATMTEQQRNRRGIEQFTAFGKTQTLPAWAEQYGLKADLVRQRIKKYRWPLERALTAPVRDTAPWDDVDTYGPSA